MLPAAVAQRLSVVSRDILRADVLATAAVAARRGRGGLAGPAPGVEALVVHDDGRLDPDVRLGPARVSERSTV